MTRDWRTRGTCRDEDPELFFPVGTGGPAVAQTTAAKRVCRRCPVVAECLAWALANGQDYGVWGGMTEDERRAQHRRLNPPSPVEIRRALAELSPGQRAALAVAYGTAGGRVPCEVSPSTTIALVRRGYAERCTTAVGPAYTRLTADGLALAGEHVAALTPERIGS